MEGQHLYGAGPQFMGQFRVPTELRAAGYPPDDPSVWPHGVDRLTATAGQTDLYGGSEAVKLLETAVSNSHTLVFDQLGVNRFNLESGRSYFLEAVVKTINARYGIMLEAWNSGFTARALATFKLTDGTLGTVSGTGTFGSAAGSITSLGSSWYRCRLSWTMTGTEFNNFFYCAGAEADNDDSYLGDVSTGILLFSWKLHRVPQ